VNALGFVVFVGIWLLILLAVVLHWNNRGD